LANHDHTTTRLLSLGLQGGGSFGAFTWGVLDRLLEDERLDLDTISGASAGAVNAVVLADGLAESGRAGARERLRSFWERVGRAPGVPAAISSSPLALMATGLTPWASPYQINPLGLNPLRDLIASAVDFERLREGCPIRLIISATRVRDGQPRMFREHEITLDVVLASACLPFLQHAVELDRESYWDGGYSANPPLRELVIEMQSTELLLVRLVPEAHDMVPHLPHEIARRVREIGFNTSLLRELDAVEDLRRACKGQVLFRSGLCRKLTAMRFHQIDAAEHVPGLASESPLNTSWVFLERLHEAGWRAGEEWLRAQGE
jgi:NTE family protein